MHYIIITGSSKGIGQALAHHYLNKGAKVIGMARSEATINHENYIHHCIDLGDLSALEQLMPSLFPLISPQDTVALVNNAGVLGEVGYVGEIDLRTAPHVMQLNVSAAAMLMHGFIQNYAQVSSNKVILNISSGAGKAPVDGWAAYCASKAALDLYSKVVDEECRLRANGIRVFAVAPGVVDTAMQSQIRSANPSDFSKLQRFLDLKASNQLSATEEVASKLAQLIETPDRYDEVIQDVRNF
jgi:benzil reductase ((S)-benzoin forming)